SPAGQGLPEAIDVSAGEPPTPATTVDDPADAEERPAPIADAPSSTTPHAEKRPAPVIDETFSADDVAAYYDDWNERYEAVFGDVYQHLKAGDHAQLLDHMLDIAAMAPGEHLVDAGCGVCGPARYFSRAVD